MVVVVVDSGDVGSESSKGGVVGSYAVQYLVVCYHYHRNTTDVNSSGTIFIMLLLKM